MMCNRFGLSNTIPRLKCSLTFALLMMGGMTGCGDSAEIKKLDRGCMGGHARDCFSLASKLERSDSSRAKKYRKRAIALSKDSCEVEGDANACYLLAARLYAGTPEGVAMNKRKAKFYFQRSCVGGNDRACTMIRVMEKGK